MFRNTPQRNFNRNSYISIQENAFENIVCETAAILSRGRWVNEITTTAGRALGALGVGGGGWGGGMFVGGYECGVYTNKHPQQKTLWGIHIHKIIIDKYVPSFRVWHMREINDNYTTTRVNIYVYLTQRSDDTHICGNELLHVIKNGTICPFHDSWSVVTFTKMQAVWFIRIHTSSSNICTSFQ